METTETLPALLRREGIAYELTEHPAVFTIEEMLALHLPHSEAVAKNLFLRDDKKRQYYLVCARQEKRIDLKELQKKIASRRLSFASEEDLQHLLRLTKGSVTPLGILNDTKRLVSVVLDEAFRGSLIGVHPNRNTATVWLQTEDLVRLLEQHGNPVRFVAL